MLHVKMGGGDIVYSETALATICHNAQNCIVLYNNNMIDCAAYHRGGVWQVRSLCPIEKGDLGVVVTTVVGESVCLFSKQFWT
jgi:hypothetical protein